MCKKKIVVIGGGFGGARLIQEIATKAKSIDLILIDNKEYFEVTFAILREMVEQGSTGKDLRKKYKDFIQAEFIRGKVTEIDKKKYYWITKH
jgi:NADH dehydrogenase FAD-containing subunit